MRKVIYFVHFVNLTVTKQNLFKKYSLPYGIILSVEG